MISLLKELVDPSVCDVFEEFLLLDREWLIGQCLLGYQDAGDGWKG